MIYFSGLALENHQISKRSKSIIKSEQYFKNNLVNLTIIRPGVIIGGGDQFMKRLLPIFKFSPIIPLFGSGNAKIQPVFVDDVARAVLNIISKNLFGNNIYELVGIEIFTYKSIYSHIAKCLGSKKYLFSVPFFLIKSLVFILEKIRFSPIYLEQLNLLKTDNFTSNKYKDFSDLNIDPQNIREIIKNIVK